MNNEKYPSIKSTILIIDDDPEYIAAVKNLLEVEDHTVSAATSVLEGWRMIEKEKPEILLIDWKMPNVNGIEGIKSIKSSKDFYDMYIIMVSGRSNSTDKVVGIMSGADDYLAKPVVPQELLARIQAGVRILRLQRDLREQVRKNTVLEMALSITDKIGNPLAAGLMIQQFLKTNIHKLTNSDIEQSIDDLGKVFLEVRDLLEQYLTLKNPKTISGALGKPMIDIKNE